MIGKIDIEKTLQLQPNKECLFVSVATVLNHVVDAVNELQEFCDVADKNLAKLMEEATRTETVQQVSYTAPGDITVFHGFNCSVEFDIPLPKGTRITIKSITKGGDND